MKDNAFAGKFDTLKILVYPVTVILGLYIILYLFNDNILSENPFNTYTLQSLAWLDGRLDLGQDYSWLELAIFEGKYYVSFPPFPSYVFLPFVLIFGENNPESLLNVVFALVGVVYSTLIVLEYKLGKTYASILPILLYASSAVLQIILTDGVWFVAQNMALTFTLMSVYSAKKGQKGISLFLLCCACGCRPFQLIYLPLIIYIYMRQSKSTLKEFLLNRIYVFVPTVVLSMSYLLLNFARFGSVFEFGHNYLPEFTSSEHGQFSVNYISENFYNLFRLPSFSFETRMEMPFFNGMNIFICFPILIWYIYILFKGKAFSLLNITVISCVIIHIMVLLSHKTMGGYHYGNRYIIDVMAAIFIGVCNTSTGVKKYNFHFLGALLIFGMAFNLMAYSEFLSL